MKTAFDMTPAPVAVEFEAEVRKVTSTVGHTYSVTLNLPEYCTEQAQVIMGWLEDLVKVVMVVEDKE